MIWQHSMCQVLSLVLKTKWKVSQTEMPRCARLWEWRGHLSPENTGSEKDMPPFQRRNRFPLMLSNGNAGWRIAHLWVFSTDTRNADFNAKIPYFKMFANNLDLKNIYMRKNWPHFYDEKSDWGSICIWESVPPPFHTCWCWGSPNLRPGWAACPLYISFFLR